MLHAPAQDHPGEVGGDDGEFALRQVQHPGALEDDAQRQRERGVDGSGHEPVEHDLKELRHVAPPSPVSIGAGAAPGFAAVSAATPR